MERERERERDLSSHKQSARAQSQAAGSEPNIFACINLAMPFENGNPTGPGPISPETLYF